MTLPRLSCVPWPGYVWVCHLKKQLDDVETKTCSLVVRRACVSCVTICSYWPDIGTLVCTQEVLKKVLMVFCTSVSFSSLLSGKIEGSQTYVPWIASYLGKLHSSLIEWNIAWIASYLGKLQTSVIKWNIAWIASYLGKSKHCVIK